MNDDLYLKFREIFAERCVEIKEEEVGDFWGNIYLSPIYYLSRFMGILPEFFAGLSFFIILALDLPISSILIYLTLTTILFWMKKIILFKNLKTFEACIIYLCTSQIIYFLFFAGFFGEIKFIDFKFIKPQIATYASSIGFLIAVGTLYISYWLKPRKKRVFLPAFRLNEERIFLVSIYWETIFNYSFGLVLVNQDEFDWNDNLYENYRFFVVEGFLFGEYKDFLKFLSKGDGE